MWACGGGTAPRRGTRVRESLGSSLTLAFVTLGALAVHEPDAAAGEAGPHRPGFELDAQPGLGGLHRRAALPDDQALRQHRAEGPGRVVGRLLEDREPERQPDVR